MSVLLLFITGCASVVKQEESKSEEKETVNSEEEIIDGVVSYSTGDYPLTPIDKFAQKILLNELDLEENYQDSTFREMLKQDLDNDVYKRVDDDFKEEIERLIYNEDKIDYTVGGEIILQTSQFINNVMYMFRGSYITADTDYKTFKNEPEFIGFSLESPVYYVAPHAYQNAYSMEVSGDMVTSNLDNTPVKVDQRINFYY